MARRSPGAKLTVIPKAPVPEYPQPPTKLGATGMVLWRSVVESYAFHDPGSVETLHQCCLAADRAQACREIIDRDGEMLKTKAGVRAHPLLREELNNRMFVTRSLQRLGLDLEPVRAGPGRPAGMSFT